MINISVRRQRFLKMWVKQFAIGLTLVLGLITAMVLLAWGAVTLSQAFGTGAVVLAVGLLICLGFLAGITGSITEAKLAKLEREEEATMNALKRDSNQYNIDEELELFRKQIRNMKTSFTNSGKGTIV